MGKQGTNSTKSSTGANLGFDQKLWAAADKLRGHMDASEYKHVVLGLIFLKYISDAFEEKHAELQKEKGADPEDRDEYTADNIFWVPSKARWTSSRAEQDNPVSAKTWTTRWWLSSAIIRRSKAFCPKNTPGHI